jgi:hypothetical protein
MVVAATAHRLRFWHKDGGEQVQFRKAGSKLIAAVTGGVMVYKLPKVNEFHREYMAHNARALWLGLQSDPDRLVDNMLEYVETI